MLRITWDPLELYRCTDMNTIAFAEAVALEVAERVQEANSKR